MLYIVLGGVRLGCSCSALETHSMKLCKHRSWADLKTTWGLEVCSDWLCGKLATSVHHLPHHLLTPLCYFTWSSTSWLSCYHYQSLPLCLTCCIGVILSRYHAELLRATNSFTGVCRFYAPVAREGSGTPEFSHLDGWLNTFGNLVYILRFETHNCKIVKCCPNVGKEF